jgi:hypothetical protein
MMWSKAEIAGAFLGTLLLGIPLILLLVFVGLFFNNWLLGVLPGPFQIAYWVLLLLYLAGSCFANIVRRLSTKRVAAAFFVGLLSIVLLLPLRGPDFGADFADRLSPQSLTVLAVDATIENVTFDMVSLTALDVASVTPVNTRAEAYILLVRLCVLFGIVRLLVLVLENIHSRVLIADNRAMVSSCIASAGSGGTIARLGKVYEEDPDAGTTWSIEEVAEFGRALEPD